jgi:hypothetical protein
LELDRETQARFAEGEGRPYTFRKRQPHQVKLYTFLDGGYKRQMRHIPEAYVKPQYTHQRSKSRNGSPDQGGEGESQDRDWQEGGTQQELDEEGDGDGYNRYLSSMHTGGRNGGPGRRNASTVPPEDRGEAEERQDVAKWYPRAFEEMTDDESDDGNQTSSRSGGPGHEDAPATGAKAKAQKKSNAFPMRLPKKVHPSKDFPSISRKVGYSLSVCFYYIDTKADIYH